MDGPVPAEGGYPGEGLAAQPNFRETSASALFVYALAKAQRIGILHGQYHEVAKKGWAGVKSKVVISGDQVTIKDTVVGLSLPAPGTRTATCPRLRTSRTASTPRVARSARAPATAAARSSRRH